jgi:hypothetical protein
MLIRQKVNLPKWDGLFGTCVIHGGHKVGSEEVSNHQRVAKFNDG